MDTTMLYQHLLNELTKRIPANDPSHDLGHIHRVTNLARTICLAEHGDLEIIIPAALLHDIVTYPKNDSRNQHATTESAQLAEEILQGMPEYPQNKIPHVKICISECSWSKGLPASTLESKIMQDADRLEAVGAIAIMRTFSSGGAMNRMLYNPEDPFCEHSVPAGIGASYNLMHQRLLKVYATLHTKTARTIGLRRTEFLKSFEMELKLELEESGVYTNPHREKTESEWRQEKKYR